MKNPQDQMIFFEFEQYLFKQGLSKTTTSGVLSRIKRLDELLTKIDGENFYSFLVEHQNKYTSASVNKYIQAVRHYCAFIGEDWGKEFKRRREQIRSPNTFTLEEIKSFFSLECENPARLKRFNMWTTLFKTMYLTGMRPKEICNLRTCDVDLNRHLFRVRDTKTTNDRDIPLPDLILKEIKDLLDGDFIFSRLTGTKLTPQIIYVNFRRRLLRAGLKDKSPYSFRHTFATDLADNEASIYDIKVLLGHTKITTTERYLHTSYKKLHRSVSKHTEIRKSIDPVSKIKLIVDDLRKSGILEDEYIHYEITSRSIKIEIKADSERN